MHASTTRVAMSISMDVRTLLTAMRLVRLSAVSILVRIQYIWVALSRSKADNEQQDLPGRLSNTAATFKVLRITGYVTAPKAADANGLPPRAC